MPARALPMPFLSLFVSRRFLPLLVLAFGCGKAPVARAPEPPAPGPSPASEFSSSSWETLALSEQPVELALPAAGGWQQTRSGSFGVLHDARSRSTLVIRVWRAARLVHPAECEAEARLARPSLAVVDPSTLIEERELGAPTGFHGVLRVAAMPAEVGEVKGVVVAVGAAVGRCVIATFETRSDGKHAAETVADRLSAIVAGTFDTLRIVEVEERVLNTPRG